MPLSTSRNYILFRRRLTGESKPTSCKIPVMRSQPLHSEGALTWHTCLVLFVGVSTNRLSELINAAIEIHLRCLCTDPHRMTP